MSRMWGLFNDRPPRPYSNRGRSGGDARDVDGPEMTLSELLETIDGRIQPGDEVTCPKCERTMIRCLRTPEIGSVDYPDCFEPVEWDGGVGSRTLCPFDGEAWMWQGPFRIHVKGKGWLSG